MNIRWGSRTSIQRDDEMKRGSNLGDVDVAHDRSACRERRIYNAVSRMSRARRFGGSNFVSRAVCSFLRASINSVRTEFGEMKRSSHGHEGPRGIDVAARAGTKTDGCSS